MPQNTASYLQPVQRLVRLERIDYETVQRIANQRRLGADGFDVALRLIIREWLEMQADLPYASFRQSGTAPD